MEERKSKLKNLHLIVLEVFIAVERILDEYAIQNNLSIGISVSKTVWASFENFNIEKYHPSFHAITSWYRGISLSTFLLPYSAVLDQIVYLYKVYS